MTTPSQVSSEPKKFARDILWVAMSQIFVSLLGIITLPVFTKTYTTEMYGIWTQVSVTVSLISPLLTLQFGTAVVRFLAGEDEKAVRSRSLGAMLTAIVIFALLVLIIMNLLASQISVFLFDSPAYPTFVHLTFFWTFTDALFLFFISYLRARGKIKGLSIIQASFALSKMAAVVAMAKLDFGLIWIVGCIVLIELIFSLGLFNLIAREEGFPKPNFVRIREFLSFSVPQIPSAIFLWIISTSDRFFITHFLTLSETGIYSSSFALGSLIALFYSPIAFVLLPVVSKAWEKKQKTDVRKYFEYSTRLFLIMAIPGAAGVAMLSQSLLNILTTPDYLVGWQLVLLIAVGTIFLGIYQLNLYIIYLIKQTRWLPLMIIIASAASTGLNLILIPRVGIIGAAIANMVSYFILAGIVTAWARKAISYSFDFIFLGKVIAASLAMSLYLYFLRANSITSIILLILSGIMVFIIVLLLLRTFSETDRGHIKQFVKGMVPWVH